MQLVQSAGLPELTTLELVGRIALAAALGGLIGFEREFSDQPAGFRTHILVSIGAALFTLVGAYGINEFVDSGRIRFDPTRISAQIVTGIGFLGAGAILRQGVNVRGLTTAAALWVTAAIGTAVGFGYWIGATATTVVTVAALYGLKRLERVLFPRFRSHYHRVEIEMGPELRLSDLETAFSAHDTLVYSMKILTDDEGNRHLVARVKLASTRNIEILAEELRGVEGVRDVGWAG